LRHEQRPKKEERRQAKTGRPKTRKNGGQRRRTHKELGTNWGKKPEKQGGRKQPVERERDKGKSEDANRGERRNRGEDQGRETG
jgi:hypothetical protein